MLCGMGTNGVGQRTRMDDGSGFTTWSYDSRGRVTEVYQSVTGGGNFRTQWSYNSADLPVWMRYPLDNGGNLGETVNFTYNTQMLLDRVYGTDTYVDDTWYDAAGRVTLRELGNNYTLGQTYTYYPWTQQGGRLQNLKSGIALDTDSLQSLSYVYDDVGNVQSITDTNAGGTQTQTFTYDALDRLSSAVASGGTGGTYALKDYDYDTQGRLEINGTVTNYYENTAHIHAVSKTSTGNTYSYDQNGNQTSRKVGGITYTLIYDAENRLVQIKRGSNIQATYTYDGDGNRVKTVVGSTTTTYIGNYLERECINTTCALKSYYYAAGQRVALRKGDGTLYFLLTDHLGSTAITATSSGGRDAELRYYPWGGTRYTYGTTPTSYRYTGQREAEVGLYYYGARFYDPYLNRWIQPDSIIPDQYNPMDWDRFNYVRNNPLVYIDSSGHDPEATEPNPPIFTYDEEHGFCINIFRVGCTGGDSYREWYFNWYLPRLPEFTHSHLTEISLFSQDVALGASSAGAGFEVVGFLAGGHPGAIAGNALHQSTTNPIESIASGVSTGATLLDDIFFTPGSGSYMNDAGVFVISDATATSVVATVIGSIVPIAMVDSAIDGYASRYNHGQAPGIFEWLGINGVTLFGLIQLGQ